MNSSLLDLSELDIDTTCPLTKVHGFDSLDPSPQAIPLTRSMSEQASRSSEEYFRSLGSPFNDGNYQNVSVAPRLPINGWPNNSWRKTPGAINVTPNIQTTNQFSDDPLVKTEAGGARGFPHNSLLRKYPESIIPSTGVPAIDHSATNSVFQSNGNGQYASAEHSNINGRYTPVEAIKSEPLEYFPFGANRPGSPPSRPFGVNLTSQIPIQHLNNCYAYAINRGNGQYTRLIPADCLSPLAHIPKLQDASGLILLPAPRGPTPYSYTGQPSNTEYAPTQSAIGFGRPTSAAHKSPQAMPSLPTTSLPRPFSSNRQGNGLRKGNSNGGRGANVSANINASVQSTIDSIIATLPEAQTKKMKVYCDKWIHSGLCAFEQQGCRYKHEMPADKETQMSVGLFSGLPTWYLKCHPELRPSKSDKASPSESVRSPRVASFSPRNQGRSGLFAGGPWRSGNGNSNGHGHGHVNGGRGDGGGWTKWKHSPPTPQTGYNYGRNFGASHMSPNSGRTSNNSTSNNNDNNAGYTNGSPPAQRWGFERKHHRSSGPRANAFDLLYSEQDQQEEIDDGEV